MPIRGPGYQKQWRLHYWRWRVCKEYDTDGGTCNGKAAYQKLSKEIAPSKEIRRRYCMNSTKEEFNSLDENMPLSKILDKLLI